MFANQFATVALPLELEPTTPEAVRAIAERLAIHFAKLHNAAGPIPAPLRQAYFLYAEVFACLHRVDRALAYVAAWAAGGESEFPYDLTRVEGVTGAAVECAHILRVLDHAVESSPERVALERQLATLRGSLTLCAAAALMFRARARPHLAQIITLPCVPSREAANGV